MRLRNRCSRVWFAMAVMALLSGGAFMQGSTAECQGEPAENAATESVSPPAPEGEGQPAGERAAQTARIVAGDLEVGIIDTGQHIDHTNGLSGVFQLVHKARPHEQPILKTGALLNFEHVFSGDADTYPRHIMAPRLSPMKLTKIDDTTVQLSQGNAGEWPLATTLTYKVVPPCYIDFTIEFKATGAEGFSKHNYLGLFFASYIDFPRDRSIYFIGRDRDSREPFRWIKAFSPAHGVRSAHRSTHDDFEMPTDPGFNIMLANGDSEYEYAHPFYFGRFREMVLIQMFETSSILRFAQSPCAGGLKRHPAWDFFLLTPDFKVGETYRARGRMVYKPFVSAADVIDEYEKWIELNIERPAKAPVYGEPFAEDLTAWPYRQ